MRVELADDLLEKDEFPPQFKRGTVVKVKVEWYYETQDLSQHIYVEHDNGKILGWLEHEIKPLEEG